MRIMRYILFVAFAVLASCGGTAERNKENIAEEAAESAETIVVDYDSLFAAMDVRYNALCEQRRQAYAERDTERRQALIEANDRACIEFDDSLQRFLKAYKKQ